jgi:hypothetical protein
MNLDTTREDFVRSIDARAFNLEHGADPRPRKVFNQRMICQIPDAQMEAFQTRLQALIDEFTEMEDVDGEDSHPWAFTVLLYPSFYYNQPEDE